MRGPLKEKKTVRPRVIHEREMLTPVERLDKHPVKKIAGAAQIQAAAGFQANLELLPWLQT
jgi:hypothetical protein